MLHSEKSKDLVKHYVIPAKAGIFNWGVFNLDLVMQKKKYVSVEDYRKNLSKNQQAVIEWLEKIMVIQPNLQRNCLFYKFENKTFLYCNTLDSGIILWFWQWAKLIKKYPILEWAFDENLKVVSKIFLHSPEDIGIKGVKDIIWLLRAL